jgi:hypothetical protein
MTTTAELVAGQLRDIADGLAALGGLPVEVRLTITPQPPFYSVEAVDTVAAAFGLTAEPAPSGSLWCHQARQTEDGLYLRVYTFVDAPAVRCACGAVCTHTGGAR